MKPFWVFLEFFDFLEPDFYFISVYSSVQYNYHLILKVWVNNKVVRTMDANTNTQSRHWFSSWMLYLKKEDTVGIQVITSSSSISKTIFHFSGSLIKTDTDCRNECSPGYYGYPNCKSKYFLKFNLFFENLSNWRFWQFWCFFVQFNTWPVW